MAGMCMAIAINATTVAAFSTPIPLVMLFAATSESLTPTKRIRRVLLFSLGGWLAYEAIMVTEFAWRAEENTSGNSNTMGAGSVVKTQADRGANYSGYVEDLFSYPMVVGAHWFEFADQSPQGRGVDIREDSNYGIVDIKHRPYKTIFRVGIM